MLTGRGRSVAGPGATVAPDGDESRPGGLLSGDPAFRRIMLAGSEFDGGVDPTPAADVEAGTVELEMAEAGPAAGRPAGRALSLTGPGPAGAPAAAEPA